MKNSALDDKTVRNGDHTPIRKTVFEHLRQEILRGTLNHGERLIETEIAKRLKISRTPVREAFRKLENEGLVKYSPGRGVTVSKISQEDMEEIYSIREVLEGLTARLAAERISKQEIKGVRNLLQEMARSYKSRDYRSVVRLHTQFNEMICHAAHSPRLHDLTSRFNEYTERSQLRALGVPDRFKAIQAEHEKIVQALEKGNPQLAEEAVRFHVGQARATYLKSLQQWGL